MRVGILAPIAPEKIGGGFTFEQEIFERLLEVAPESKHEFMIFEGFRGAKNSAKAPGFQCVPLKRPLSEYLILRKRKFPWEHKWIDHALKSEGIEFFLNTTFEAVTLDIPFAAIVWDLQHRLQPFFPEVSAGGMGEHREAFCSQVLKRGQFVGVGPETGRKEGQKVYGVPVDQIRM